MWKPILAGAAALAIGGSAFVYAQGPAGPSAPVPQARDSGPRSHMSAEDAQAFAEARIAALKAGLQLSPEQEKNWPPVETAMRDLAKQRIDRMAEFRNRMAERREHPAPRDAIEFLRRRADTMTQHATGLKRLADASEPLYKSLDDGQKRRLTMLASAMRPGEGGAHGQHGRFHRGPMGPDGMGGMRGPGGPGGRGEFGGPDGPGGPERPR